MNITFINNTTNDLFTITAEELTKQFVASPFYRRYKSGELYLTMAIRSFIYHPTKGLNSSYSTMDFQEIGRAIIRHSPNANKHTTRII